MARRKKLIKMRKPRVYVDSDGDVSVVKPSFRVGDKIGFNVSSRGVSFSMRSRFGTYSSRRGCTIPCGCSALGVFALFSIVAVTVLIYLI